MLLDPIFDINGRTIGVGHSPFVIAEAGSNFNQDLDTGKRLIDAAAKSAADAVKFQLFRADALYPDGGDIHAAFKAVELDPDWVPVLARHAADQGLAFMASAFDLESLGVLEAVGVAAHKVASSETTNLKLVRAMAATGKPLFVSTGMCDLADVDEAVTAIEESGCARVVLLQCGAVYPLPPEDANLRVMDTLATAYGCPVGFSDHTLGVAVSTAAVGRGASAIEKHFTLDRSAEGPDHFYALEPDELDRFVSGIRDAHAALGGAVKRMLTQERSGGRRDGLYAARDIAAGTVLTARDVAVRRPAVGMRGRFLGVVLGSVCARDVAKDAPIDWDAVAP